DGEGLDGGARLEGVDQGAVAGRRRVQLLAVVGVVGGLVDHGEDLAALDVDHHQAAGPSAEFVQRVAQFAVGQVLQAQVDGQLDVAAGLGVEIGRASCRERGQVPTE